MKIGLVVLATGKYAQFAKPMISSFLKWIVIDDAYVQPIVLTDDMNADFGGACRVLPATHYPNFIDCMTHRYEQVLRHCDQYEADGADYIIHADVDLLAVESICNEIISPDVFCTTSPNLPSGEKFWATGSLLGGQIDSFLDALEEVQDMIDSNPIQRTYPEEYWWNQWLKVHPPSVILSQMYCCPDRPSRRDQEPKIVTLTTKFKEQLNKEKLHA